MLSLGFTRHTHDLNYLYDSVEGRSTSVSIILINSGAMVWDRFLLLAYHCEELESVLAGMSAARIIDAYSMYDSDDDDPDYNSIRTYVLEELRRKVHNK